jgi:hypothetical protein
MTTISSTTDIRVWVQNGRPDVTGDDVSRLVDAIRSADHPAYGTDWSEWLAAFDYVVVLA